MEEKPVYCAVPFVESRKKHEDGVVAIYRAREISPSWMGAHLDRCMEVC